MKKLLFISGNINHTNMFRGIVNSLDRLFDCKVLGLNSIKKEGCQNQIIPLKDIGEFNSLNCEKILKEYSPDVVILSCDYSPVEQAFVLAARNIDIPTLLIQDGIIASNEMNENVSPLSKISGQITSGLVPFTIMYLYLLTTAISILGVKGISYLLGDMKDRFVKTHTYGLSGCDRILVYSEGQKNVFISNGVNPDGLIVV